MPKLSKFVCILACIGAVAGGVTMGIGALQGGNYKDAMSEGITYETKTLLVNEEQEFEGLNISLTDGEIYFEETNDDILKVEYNYIHNFGYITSFDINKIDIGNKKLDIGSGLLGFGAVTTIKRNVLKVYVPSWYTGVTKVKLNFGLIKSNVKNIGKEVDMQLNCGEIDIKSLTMQSKMNYSVNVGSLKIDVDELSNSCESYKLFLEVNVGNIDVKVSNNIDYSKGDENSCHVGTNNFSGNVENALFKINTSVDCGSVNISKRA